MNIVFFETTNSDKEYLQKALAESGAVLSYTSEILTTENCKDAVDAEIISVFVNSPVTKEIIDALPHLKLITTRSTGFDHIDVTYAKSKGIVVATVPAYGSRTVAEFAFTLILALSRKLIPSYSGLRMNNSFDMSNSEGFDLAGKTIGVIGTGKIGKNAIRIARGFDMNVLAYDMFPDAAFATQNSVKYVDLIELLKQSDVVTLHAPYTKVTHHLINKQNVKYMKKGALLVNTARGELIETDALVWALNEGIIGGAGLDVLEGERYMKNEMKNLSNDIVEPMEDAQGMKIVAENEALIHHPRVIVTPHVAFFSKEAKEEILKTTVENITGYLKGAVTNSVQVS